MAEEDEIDVLGDFNLDNFLAKNDSSIYGGTSLVSQNSELLNCDYTIHPQWLLDKPSANPDNWYDTNPNTALLEKTQNDSDMLGHVSTENCITDESGWTEKEKNLLERGIEIFGKSNVRLSQFVGSKTPAEVRYYLKNFYLENQNAYESLGEVVEEISDSNLVEDVLDDTQIPASIEEVIAAVSTAKPTVQVHNKKPRKKSTSFNSDTYEVDPKDIPSGQSLLKSNYLKLCTDNHSTKESNIKKSESLNKLRKVKVKSIKFKFKTKLKMPPKENRTAVKQKTVKIMNVKNKKAEFSKVEITTGKGLSVPICEGEEIVKLKKVEDDTDEDIDVEDSDEEVKIAKQVPKLETPILKQNTNTAHQTLAREIVENSSKHKVAKSTGNNGTEIKQVIDLSTLDELTVKDLMSLDPPKSEVVLGENTITELEKVFHSDFFEGRPVKTPVRYLKIRNHIINIWVSQKPNYVLKTTIRQGLRNCGDVNTIGRVHLFLEQIGAINFGSPQINYIRPLYDLMQLSQTKERSTKCTKEQPTPHIDSGSRPRFKKKFTNDGEGGCTLTHDEKGHVINTTVINEEPIVKKLYIKKPTIRLIYCRPFTEQKPQPYTIRVHLSTLLTLDFHAHTSLTEVMGLVAGYWIPQTKILFISHYEPCLNIASSATHCDMCPISQAKAADSIYCKGLDILGWFHSHPTFAPEPSQQDLETQQVVQQWIGHNKPCIGVILSPFSLNGALIASPLRCMVVDKKLNFDDQIVPYKFKVEIVTENFDEKDLLRDIRRVLRDAIGRDKESRVDFCKPYFQDSTINYLEKFITSVRMHLAKCGTLDDSICNKIIQAISEICINKTSVKQT